MKKKSFIHFFFNKMDTYQRPITPPIDRTKDQIYVTAIPTANGGIATIPSYLETDDLSDSSHLQRQQEAIHNNRSSLSSLDTSHSANSRHSSDVSSNAPLSASYNTPSGAPLSASYNTTSSAPSAPFNTTTATNGSGYKSNAPSSTYNIAATAPSSTYNTSASHKSNNSTYPSALNATSNMSSVSNPFTKENNTSIPATRKLSHLDQESTSPSKKTFSSTFENEHAATKKYHGYERNETTHRMETEVLSILQWNNPVRSAALFAMIVGSIILTRWYSLLQIGSTCLTLAIGINLIYVNLILQSQKVLTNHEASHPYSDVIDNDKHRMIDQRSVRHYSTVISELSETVVRALTRIIFIENTLTSLKWMAIFFSIWKISAHFSTMDIILMVVISAFTFPRLYISNKEVVDAQFHKGQTLLQTGIYKAQSAATENAQNTYVKARAYVAQVGTTGTDAKNTMSKHSVTIKDEKTL